MLKYIIKRLAQSILILLGVSLIIYVLIRCMPVDFVTQKLSSITTTGAETSQELIDAMLKQYGLDTNIFEGYISWLGKLLRLDFGNSFKYSIPVIDVIKDHMGVSFAVAAIATIFEFLIAIPLGVTAATHQYSLRDYIVTVLVMIGISLPSFFFGQLLKNIFAIQPHFCSNEKYKVLCLGSCRRIEGPFGLRSADGSAVALVHSYPHRSYSQHRWTNENDPYEYA